MTHKGSQSNFWRGGKYTTPQGYCLIHKPEHPFKNNHGYIQSHRLVYEQYLSIVLDEDVFIPKSYEVHHINGNKQQNNLINLELLTKSQHSSLTFKDNKFPKKDMSDRICLLCNKKTPIDNRGHECWYKYKDGFICRLCKGKQYNSKRIYIKKNGLDKYYEELNNIKDE